MTDFSNSSNSNKTNPDISATVSTDVYNNIATRPDRNTHNGQVVNINLSPEEVNKQQMMDSVTIMLKSVGEDPEREGLLKTPKSS